MWSYAYGTNAIAVDVDASGFVYVGGFDRRVVKLDPQGSVVWTQDVASVDASIAVEGIAVSPGGHVYAYYDDMSLFKLDLDGTTLWQYSWVNTNTYKDLLVDSAGNTYFVRYGDVVSVDDAGSLRWTYVTDGGRAAYH